MNHPKSILIILLASMLCNCGAIYSTDPIGEKPCELRAEDWDGTWLGKDIFISVSVIDGPNGLIKASWIEMKDNEARLESHEVQLRQSGDWVFANVKADNESAKGLYVWAPAKHDGSEAVCWLPNVEKFKDLCRTGKLPCSNKNDNLVLDSLTSEHMKIITSEMESPLYEWRDPLFFVRLTGKDR